MSNADLPDRLRDEAKRVAGDRRPSLYEHHVAYEGANRIEALQEEIMNLENKMRKYEHVIVCFEDAKAYLDEDDLRNAKRAMDRAFGSAPA